MLIGNEGKRAATVGKGIGGVLAALSDYAESTTAWARPPNDSDP
jgi:hypothetical protein